MLQCSLAVSQRAWKRRFPLFVLEFCLGGGYHPSCRVRYICTRNAAPTLWTCTQILIMTRIISIELLQMCISPRKTDFSVSGPLRSETQDFWCWWFSGFFDSFFFNSNDSEFSPHNPIDILTTDITMAQLGVVIIAFSRVYLIQLHSLREWRKRFNSKFLL